MKLLVCTQICEVKEEDLKGGSQHWKLGASRGTKMYRDLKGKIQVLIFVAPSARFIVEYSRCLH